jgi:hypothetical protein
LQFGSPTSASLLNYAHTVLIAQTRADSSFLGHSYFGSVRTILSDVFYLPQGIEAAKRAALRETAAPCGKYYRFAL